MAAPELTLDELRAAGPGGWSLVPIADIWERELLPILLARSHASDEWRRTMRFIARRQHGEAAARRYDPFSEQCSPL